MASLRCTSAGVFCLEFRFQGQKIHRSLRTKDRSEATQLKAIVERTLNHLEQGVLRLSDSATADHLWKFVLSGGRATSTPKMLRTMRVGQVAEGYFESFPEGSKEASTLATEQHHVNHFLRIVGAAKPFAEIGGSDLNAYVVWRQQEKGIRGKSISPVTICKELQTFRQIWQFAKGRGYVSGENPVGSVNKPRPNDKPPFMAWEEIERRISRGGLTDGETEELWDSLFLREHEVADFLGYIRNHSPKASGYPFIYPALVFCAYTGARRSEMFRAHVDDVNGRVLLRQKKNRQDRRITFREVPLHEHLKETLDEWLEHHAGGQMLFCKRNGKPLEDKSSRDALAAVTRNSRWKVLRGFHVLRHSFASNLARHGIDQYKIDELMGHQTEEMRRRYRHLFPEDKNHAVSMLRYEAAFEGP